MKSLLANLLCDLRLFKELCESYTHTAEKMIG